ncbi:MAG: hypothetical protein KF841_05800 [Phycisphaerae bacterium]|nr:hypothetical protein [Phycisphaerae bacterium]
MRKVVSISDDRASRLFRISVVALLAVIAVALWDSRPSLLPQAVGQIPDTALQRKQMVDEQRTTNQLLARILKHLETKPIKTRAAGTDDFNDAGERPDAARSPFAGRPSR